MASLGNNKKKINGWQALTSLNINNEKELKIALSCQLVFVDLRLEYI